MHTENGNDLHWGNEDGSEMIVRGKGKRAKKSNAGWTVVLVRRVHASG